MYLVTVMQVRYVVNNAWIEASIKAKLPIALSSSGGEGEYESRIDGSQVSSQSAVGSSSARGQSQSRKRTQTQRDTQQTQQSQGHDTVDGGGGGGIPGGRRRRYILDFDASKQMQYGTTLSDALDRVRDPKTGPLLGTDVYVMSGVFGVANPPEADFKEIVDSLGGSLIKNLTKRAAVTAVTAVTSASAGAGAGADDEGAGTVARRGRGRMMAKTPTTQTKSNARSQAPAPAHMHTALRPLVVVSSDAAWKKAKKTEVAAVESTGVASVVNSDCLFSGCVLHRVLDVTREEYVVHSFHRPDQKEDRGQGLEDTAGDDDEEEEETVEPAPKRSSRRR
jgi:hypothetical protein